MGSGSVVWQRFVTGLFGYSWPHEVPYRVVMVIELLGLATGNGDSQSRVKDRSFSLWVPNVSGRSLNSCLSFVDWFCVERCVCFLVGMGFFFLKYQWEFHSG